MLRGLYTAAASMNVLEKKSDIRANNIANANTNGFKKEGTITAAFPEMLLERIEAGKRNQEIGSLETGSYLERSWQNFSQGSVQHTNNKLDFAVQGPGFFSIATANGTAYTRDGNFTLNSNSELVTQTGNQVLDVNGDPVQLIPGQDFAVSGNGQIVFNNGLQGAQIALVDFAEDEVEQLGDNLYQPAAGVEPAEIDSTILQGYLENSNVKIVEEMAKMIKTTRQYESNQKVITTLDDSLNKVINEVGKA